jgi:hypothetical protein
LTKREPVMPISIVHSKSTPSSVQSAVVFFEHKRSLVTGSAQRAKLEIGNGVSLSLPTESAASVRRVMTG